MNLDLTIYTYGHIDSMFYVLNAIAMITNSNISNLIIKGTSAIAVFYYVTKAAYT
ncbi:MAG: hypothetical protein SFT91_00020 [Rickettsiaceae bacterium]|nr:hypothetical protein [Rickettsiaceae bacterium]